MTTPSARSLKAGATLNGVDYKVHLDGNDQSTPLETVSGKLGTYSGAKSAPSSSTPATSAFPTLRLQKIST